MTIKFTEEQIITQKMVKTFFETEVKPVMSKLDARSDPKECYPFEIIKKASKQGLRTLAIPEEYGGINTDVITKTLVLTTGAEVEAGTAKILSQCWKVSHAISQAGTEEQKQKFLGEFTNDHDYVCSICITEPNAGSDNLLPYNVVNAGISTKAIVEGDYYILNGSKQFTSLAGFSKLLLVFARTDSKVPFRQGTTTFLVPADLPGVSFGKTNDRMGFRLYPGAEVFFEDVRIPKNYILGELNAGFDTFAKIFRGSVEIPATNLGICKAMYRTVFEYAKGRIQGGKHIIEHQNVGLMLAEMAMLIDTLEAYMWDTAERVKNDANYDVKKTRFAKIFSGECIVKLSILSLDIMGGAGASKEYPLEKLVRDGLTFLHGDGTNSLNKLRVVPLLR